MNEVSGTSLNDAATPFVAGSYGSGVALGQAGLIPSASDTAARFPGGLYNAANVASVVQNTQFQAGTSFSVELIFSEDVVNPGNANDGVLDLVNDEWSVQIAPSNVLKLWLPTAGRNITIVGTTVLTPGQIYQVDATYDGTTAKLYLDGQLEGSASGSGAVLYSAVGPGGLSFGGTASQTLRNVLKGRIAHVSIYGSELSTSQIATHRHAAGLDGSAHCRTTSSSSSSTSTTGTSSSSGASSSSSSSSTGTSSSSSSSSSSTGGTTGGGCANLVPDVPATSGPVVHVSPTGSDSNSGSSAQQAFLTLAHALHNAVPGTRVLLGDGTYSQTAVLSISGVNGTAAEPIVITPEPGATPIFDFSAVSTTNAVMSFSSCSYLFIDGITLANASGTGLGIYGSSYVTMTRSTIHDVQDDAISLTGSNFVMAGNEIYNAALMNTNDKNGTWWSGTASTWYVNSTTPTTHVQWLQNKIHDTWGECINVLFADDVQVIGNELHDCYSDHVYIDHGSNVTVLRNLMYNSESQFINTGAGVGIDDESYSGYGATPEDNILVANNYFGSGMKWNLVRWELSSWAAPQNTWSNLHIVFNVFQANAVDWQPVGGGTAPSNGVIAGNIFLGNPSFSLGDLSAWSVTQNDFASGVPSQFAGNGNFSVNPNFVGPTDGSSFAGLATTNAAALAVSARAEVPQDALCVPRGQSQTAAGVMGP